MGQAMRLTFLHVLSIIQGLIGGFCMENEIKQCRKCLVNKRLEDFRKDPKYKSGYTARCIECCRKSERDYEKRNREKRVQKHREWRDSNRDKINAKNRDRWNNDPEWRARKDKYKGMYKEWRAKYSSDYKKLNREKCNAREQLRYWFAKGVIIRPEKCEMCESSDYRIEAHHFDYSKPLEVNWFCQKCHLKLHRMFKKSHVQPKRLSEETPKGDATVQTRKETPREKFEEVSPPS